MSKTLKVFDQSAVDKFEAKLRSQVSGRAEITLQLQLATDAMQTEIATIEYVARETVAEIRRRHAECVAKIVRGVA